MADMGRKGAEALNQDAHKKSEASRKAAETRGHDDMAAMGRKGGQHSHRGSNNESDKR